MTPKFQTVAITVSIASLSILVLLAILVARAWIDMGPIVDMRL